MSLDEIRFVNDPVGPVIPFDELINVNDPVGPVIPADELINVNDPVGPVIPADELINVNEPVVPVIVPPIFNVPDIIALPLTSKVADGFVVPTPSLVLVLVAK